MEQSNNVKSYLRGLDGEAITPTRLNNTIKAVAQYERNQSGLPEDVFTSLDISIIKKGLHLLEMAFNE